LGKRRQQPVKAGGCGGNGRKLEAATTAGESRRLLSWQIRKVREPAEIEYSSAAQPAMRGSVEARGASKAQPEVETPGASRVS